MQNTPPRTYSGDLADPPRALAALIEQPRWVCWRWQPGKTGGWTKPPFCCDDPTRHALNNEPRTWGTRNAAVKMVLAGKASGVGFVLTESAIAAVDIDKCRDPDTGVIDTWALEILSRAPGAYVEITVSGAGLRVIGTAEGLPTHRRFGVAGREGAGVEVYRRATRYVTVSGLQQGKCAELTNIDAVIDGIVAQYDNGTAAKNGNGHGATNGFDDIDALIRHGAPEGRRSGEFAKVVWSLAGQGLTADEIEVELQQHPTGIMAKYAMRLREEIDRCYSKWQKQQPTARTTGGDWPEPKSLPEGLLAPVGPFRLEYLPKAIAPWVGDISDRLQCPPDYVAVAAMTALGSVIGRRIGIKPQAQTDWIEVPNLWGCFIGQPGMLKSPAMMEALRPLHRLEKDAQKQNELNRKAYEAGMDAYKLVRQVKISLEKERLKGEKSKKIDASLDLGEQPKEPAAVRYRTNDTSYEKLGEILVANPAGLLVERDELVSLLKHLDREEQAVAHGFFLSGWSGQQPYSFDRIGRGHLNIEAVCISVLGNTQPARIAEYVRRANAGGAGGDGLLQRFSLMVWPDVSPEWKDIDRFPNSGARERVWATFERLSKLDLGAAIKLGADRSQYEEVASLRLDEAARERFLVWRTDLERRLRAGEMSPALEGHLAKYRKLVPTLALINHLADAHANEVADVGRDAVDRALEFSGYLESHARRVYGAAGTGELAAAMAILKRIRAGDLADGITCREILRRGWAHLTERELVLAGLDMLVDHDFVAEQLPPSSPRGGRPKVMYAINPRGRK